MVEGLKHNQLIIHLYDEGLEVIFEINHLLICCATSIRYFGQFVHSLTTFYKICIIWFVFVCILMNYLSYNELFQIIIN